MPVTPDKDPESTPEAERDALDAAMRRADEILVASLRHDERQRRSRRSRRIALLITGGLIMSAFITILLVAVLLVAPQAPAQPQRQAQKQADVAQAKALTAQGWQQWGQQNFVKAEESFEQSVALDPTQANAWNGLGWSRFNSGQVDEAGEPFQKAVELEPNHPGALNGLGQLALAQNRLDDAEKHLLQAAPNAPAAWFGLARLYLIREKYDEALPWALLCQKESPQDPGTAKMVEAARARTLSPELKAMISPPAPEKK